MYIFLINFRKKENRGEGEIRLIFVICCYAFTILDEITFLETNFFIAKGYFNLCNYTSKFEHKSERKIK